MHTGFQVFYCLQTDAGNIGKQTIYYYPLCVSTIFCLAIPGVMLYNCLKIGAGADFAYAVIRIGGANHAVNNNIHRKADAESGVSSA